MQHDWLAPLVGSWCVQVERYACLYTSHVSNLAFVSPDKSFQARLDYMAHESTDEDPFHPIGSS